MSGIERATTQLLLFCSVLGPPLPTQCFQQKPGTARARRGRARSFAPPGQRARTRRSPSRSRLRPAAGELPTGSRPRVFKREGQCWRPGLPPGQLRRPRRRRRERAGGRLRGPRRRRAFFVLLGLLRRCERTPGPVRVPLVPTGVLQEQQPQATHADPHGRETPRVSSVPIPRRPEGPGHPAHQEQAQHGQGPVELLLGKASRQLMSLRQYRVQEGRAGN